MPKVTRVHYGFVIPKYKCVKKGVVGWDQNIKKVTGGGSIQKPLNQRTYHADDFVLAPVVVVITH
jgi:hypothetical protein